MVSWSRLRHNCRKELRDVQLKVTTARLGVLSALEKSKSPQDISSVISFLEKNHIQADKATVFRIINALTEKGLAVPVQFHEDKTRYEYAGRKDHHHFVCEKCLRIIDISDCKVRSFEKNIQKKKGLLIKRHSLEFFGLCKQCQL